jgi:predicted amidophosphoribosyltransferase
MILKKEIIMLCSKCGKYSADDAAHCAECGAEFSSPAQITRPLISTKTTESHLQQSSASTTTDQIRELMQQLGIIKN